jgi:hypothetical protein
MSKEEMDAVNATVCSVIDLLAMIKEAARRDDARFSRGIVEVANHAIDMLDALDLHVQEAAA